MSARRGRGSIRHPDRYTDEDPTPPRQGVEGSFQSHIYEPLLPVRSVDPTSVWGNELPSVVWLMLNPCLSDGLSGGFNPFVWLTWIQKLDCTIPESLHTYIVFSEVVFKLTNIGIFLELNGLSSYSCIQDWDGKPLQEAPLFYHGLTELGAQTMEDISKEICEIAKAIMKDRPKVSVTFCSL